MLFRSEPDPRLSVRITRRAPLRYDAGADLEQDRPAQVRAASSIVRFGSRYVIVQDDVLFLAELEQGSVVPIVLPAPDGVRQFGKYRKNKRLKADFEAGCMWRSGGREVFLGWGSGSLPPRERVVRWDGTSPVLVQVPELYAVLREALGPAELNIEGAFQDEGGDLILMQRGNGKGGVDAIFRVSSGWVDRLVLALEPGTPMILDFQRWSLGEISGVRLTWTDGMYERKDSWWYCAAAEASRDVVEDGDVAGSAIGRICDGVGRWAPILDEGGQLYRGKVEGLAWDGDALLAVVDPDDHTIPSDLLQLQLDGPWS